MHIASTKLSSFVPSALTDRRTERGRRSARRPGIGSVRAGVLAVALAGALSLGNGVAFAQIAPGPGGPCTNPETQCGLGGHDPKQSTQVRGDEYQACNPDGHESSPANEDACENNFNHNSERPGGTVPRPWNGVKPKPQMKLPPPISK